MVGASSVVDQAANNAEAIFSQVSSGLPKGNSKLVSRPSDFQMGALPAIAPREVRQQNKVVAKVVPAQSSLTSQPDFLARAKAIWGEQPAGKPLSTVVAETRGGES